MLLNPVNLSWGRPGRQLDAAVAAAGADLLDLHRDEHHHRSVLSLVGDGAARRVARAAVDGIDLRRHLGVHPRLGAVDVVPFVPVEGDDLGPALAARGDFVRWIADELRVPAFVYGPERSLPEVRRRAFRDLRPDAGPDRPHPTAGAVCVGARLPLVAYNVWLAPPADLATARRVAAAVRRPGLRALGMQVGSRFQVSMNLVEPTVVTPATAYDAVAASAPTAGAELVGLLPLAVLRQVPEDRWPVLDLAEDRTVEWRLAARR